MQYHPPTRIFSFGASTAQGAKDSQGGFIARIGRRITWSGLGHADNLGIGGETTDDMVLRVATVTAEKADLALVTLGINDVPRIDNDSNAERRVPLERHRENVRRILGDIAAQCTVVYITQYPVAYAKSNLDQETVRSYVDAAADVAREIGITVVDVHREIDEDRFLRFIDEDGLHFNDDGHAWIAERLWALVRAHAA